MKFRLAFFTLLFSSIILQAQEENFEGAINYKINIQTKNDLISNRALWNMMAMGNKKVVWIKNGNYRQVSDAAEQYFLTKEQRVFVRFTGIDTLYFLDYDSDTTEVTKAFKTDDKKEILGVECKMFTVQLGKVTRRYFYAPSLHMNSEYDRHNKIGRFDVFANAVSSLYLDYLEETELYTMSQTAVKIQKQIVNDSVFVLPNLPRKKLSILEMTQPAEFTRSGGWEKYLQANINGQVAAKNLRISKGEESAAQQVRVRFMVNENGKVVKADVVNKKAVNSKLAEEALRVVSESPLWKPAIFIGQKVPYTMEIPITFMVTNK